MISCRHTTPINYALTDPDVGLMLQVRGGDDDAFAELFRRYESRVGSIIEHLTRDVGQTEDLAQEVFLRVYRGRHNYSPNSKFATWLFTILNNVVRSHRRKWSKRREFSQPPWNNDRDRPLEKADRQRYAEPAESIQRRETRRIVLQAVAGLSERQRRVTTLCSLRGMSYEDAARNMETTPTAVKALLNRARNNLRAALQPYQEHGRVTTGTAARER